MENMNNNLEQNNSLGKGKYYDRAATPMKYNNLVKFVLLPIALLLNGSTLADLLFNMEYASLSPVIYWIEVLACAAMIMTGLVAMIGLIAWKREGWIGVIIYFIIGGIAYRLFTAVVGVIYLPTTAEKVGVVIGTIFSLITTSLVLIYYKKRERLFQKTSSEE